MVKKTAVKKDNTKTLEEIANKLLSLMGTKAEAKVSEEKKNEALLVDIDPKDEAGLIIGRHGETLLSFQTLLNMIYKSKVGEWARIVVNVGDWREKQEEHLKELAAATAQRAKETGEDQFLYNLKPGQRRIIHMELSEDKEIETLSEGEEPERYLIVRPKKA